MYPFRNSVRPAPPPPPPPLPRNRVITNTAIKVDLQDALHTAREVADDTAYQRREFARYNPPPSQLRRALSLLAPNTFPLPRNYWWATNELQRLNERADFNKEATGANYGLVAMEQKGIPEDVIREEIMSYLKPTAQEVTRASSRVAGPPFSPAHYYEDNLKYPTSKP